MAHDVVRIAEHTVRTAVPVSLDAGEGSFGFHYCAGSASGDLVEFLYLTGVRVILIVHGVAGLIICRREQLAVGVIGIAHRCAVRMSYAGKYIRTGIIEGRRIVGAVSYGADVAEAVIGEGRYGLNAAAAVLAGDGENNIVTVADIGDLVAVGILRVAQKTIGEVADVVFLILEGVVRAALGYGQAKAVLIGVLRAGTLEVMHGPVAVKVDEVAGVSGDDRLLYIQHPASAYTHAAIGLGDGVDRAGSGLRISRVVDMVDGYGIAGTCGAHIVLHKSELAAVVAYVAGTGSVYAVGLVSVVAFKTGAVAVLDHEVRSCPGIGGIAAGKPGVGTAGRGHRAFKRRGKGNTPVGTRIVIPIYYLAGDVPAIEGPAVLDICKVQDLVDRVGSVVP